MSKSVLNWFDIPVTDLDRAMKFYSEILGIKMERYNAPGIEGALFPAGGTTGTLLKGKGFTPSQEGAVVYLNGGKDLNDVLKRVEDAGGKILLEKTQIDEERGYFAYFQDSEGNRIGLQSQG